MPCWSRSRWPGRHRRAWRALWAVSDGEKVERDDRAHPLKAKNAVWDGRTVRLAAARNEIVAFQAIVEADGAGIGALHASLPTLRRDGGGAIEYKAPVADPSLSVGRPIQLFSVHYMNVTAESHAEWAWKPGSPAAPRDTTGWKPVQLVPENARQGRGGFPLAVGPGLGQSLWVEIYVSRSLPPGLYRGTLTVTADGKAAPLPVELRVFGFTLPDENSLPVMVYYENDQPELYQGRNLDPAYHRFAHRHRVELVHAYDEANVAGASRPLRRQRLHGERRLRRPRRAQGQHHRAGVLLRTRARRSRSERAPGSARTPG